MSKTIYIGGRIESKEKGNVVTGANAILDDTKGKKQNVINKETDDELARLEQSKQDNLNFDNAPTENSTNPVTSGGVYTAEKALSDAIEAILLLIPSAATALNKLVDTNTMNSSISTATATFRGTYNAVSDLGLTYQATHAQIEAALDALGLTADNNDFAFVQIPVSDQSQDIAKTERFKFNGTNWLYEYDLNTSGFTATQWAAINSTITLALVQKLAALPTNAELLQALGLKQDVLTFDNAPTTDSNNPVKSGGIKNAIDTAVGDEATARENADTELSGLIGNEKTRAEGVEGGLNTRLGAVEGSVSTIQGVIPSEATSSNKLVDNSSMTTYIGTIIDNIDATFNVTSTDGHVTLAITQENGVITSVQVTTSDIASAAALNLKASQADLSALAGRVTTAEGNITLLGGRVSTAEGNITLLGGRVSTNETDIANLQQLYNNLQQSKPVPLTALPSTGQQQGVIYRLAGSTSYSDYMWNGSTWVLMATYNNAIDDNPTAGSDNLVKSGGVAWNSYFSAYIRNKIELHKAHRGDGTYNPQENRNAITHPLYFDKDITIYCKQGQDFAVQYFDGYEIGSSHLTFAGPWENLRVIPANTYWCMAIRNSDNSNTTEETNMSLSFSGMNNGEILINDINAISEIVSFNNIISIDTESKTISVPYGSNIIISTSKGNEEILGGYSVSYANKTFGSTLVFLQFNIDDKTLELNTINEVKEVKSKIFYPVLAKLVAVYNTNAIIDIYDSCVQVSLNGKIFSQAQTTEIINLTNTFKPYSYIGKPINLNGFNVNLFKTLNNPTSQSMAIYGDYVILFSNSDNKAYLYRISTASKLAEFNIPNGGYYQPHCNTAVVGVEFASEYSIMPAIYISQWDTGHERACFVLDVSLNNNVYSLELIQKINFSSVSSSIIGSGECDFVVDRDSQKLYAIAYQVSNSSPEANTINMICSITLPDLSDRSEILVTDTDIVSNFNLALVQSRQDAFMKNGLIYVIYGGIGNEKAGIVVVDPTSEEIVTRVPIYQYIDSEPECMDCFKNHLLFNYGSNLLELIV